MQLKHGLVRIELLLLIATLGVFMLSNQADAEAPRVAVDSGELEGLWITAPGKSDVAAFRGIPYAKPPVGELRWRAPEPPDFVAVLSLPPQPAPVTASRQAIEVVAKRWRALARVFAVTRFIIGILTARRVVSTTWIV